MESWPQHFKFLEQAFTKGGEPKAGAEGRLGERNRPTGVFHKQCASTGAWWHQQENRELLVFLFRFVWQCCSVSRIVW